MHFLIFILGLIIGSFLNVLIHRLPKEESILYPASRCPHCKARLKPLDLVPVISFIFLKGRCRHCGARISMRYPIVEVLTALILIVFYSKFSLSIDYVFYSILAMVLIVVSFTDLEHGVIPDSLSILGAIPALILWGIKEDPFTPLFGGVFGLLFMFLLSGITSFIMKKETFGEGDAKLAMILGAYLGIEGFFLSFFFAVIFGAVIAYFLLGLNIKKLGEHIPFAPFLALGALVYILYGKLLISYYLGNF